MTQNINNRDSCAYCNRNAPSQPTTFPLPSHPPFEKIFAAYFDYAGLHFLIVEDRLSGWSDVFGTPAGSTVTGTNAFLRLFPSYFATFEYRRKFSQIVAQSLLPLSHRILCISVSSNTAYLPPTSPNPTPAQRLQSKPPKDFSCPILSLMGISIMILSCVPYCICVIPRILTAIYPLLKFSLATLCGTHSRLLIGLPLFLIALFVVLGAKHGEPKKMLFEFEPSGLMKHCAIVHARCIRCGVVIGCSFEIKEADTYVNGTKLELWSKHWTSTNITLKWEGLVV